ncbi:universal stress protein [Mycobacterium sp. IS-1742]|uniref:universal stress protein n=1 Tax=Mycobacterium sp. IS-1742 TaxID=1772285 RepID=UPI000B040CFB|nr:universal stress protein [Mycobacterium sp. IS-1742]
METTHRIRPVVVGVDGSQAALDAVRWAVDEAAARSAPLRLVHATGVTRQPGRSDDEFRMEREYAETVLRAASTAAKAVGRDVDVDTDILWGPPERELLAESRTAAMICIGSVGIGAIASVVLGSTAVTVSTEAQCCVAVLRADALPAPRDWLAVATDATPESGSVITGALEEARLRGSPVVIVGVRRWESHEPSRDELDRRTTESTRRYPDVRTLVVPTSDTIVRYLAHQRERDIGMVVIGAADAGVVADIVGARGTLFDSGRRHSVLVVR